MILTTSLNKELSMPSVRGVGALLVVPLLAAACGFTDPTAAVTGEPGAVRVVAVENTWGDIARQIAGGRVRVTSIVRDPAADPHTYDVDARAASALSGATVVIENGLGYDDFADKLLRTRAKGRTRLVIAQAVGARRGANPHLWYEPGYVTTAATRIAQALTAADPAGKATFAANLAAFRKSYQPYVDSLATIKARYDGSPVAYTERVPGYLIAAAGLRLATPASFAQAVEDGDDPSPADIAAIDHAMSARTVKVLLYNAQVRSPMTERVKRLARSNGIPVVGIAESLPADARDFQTWQIQQARSVLAALEGT
jgi:zinc/manganese transport system substrate-binding protein